MSNLKLIKATYGEIDCTEQIKSKINNDILVIRSNNSIIGDPQPGYVKYLELELEYQGENYSYRIKEGNQFIFPKTNLKRLGIFYSNNNIPSVDPVIRLSLKSIERAAKGKADILTCMWQNQSENPFPEFIAWTQTYSHLNQLLQIMQLLYQAQELGNYEYVSFLEHDVLYPEGYFDFPDFEKGCVMTNMNYIGINSNGFQPLGQRDEPFHQMTMRFDEAIKHCESILANALKTNAGLIEPQNLLRKQWNCVHPAIHVNHGKHFTSHFNIYTQDTFDTQDYWGYYKDIWPYPIYTI